MNEEFLAHGRMFTIPLCHIWKGQGKDKVRPCHYRAFASISKYLYKHFAVEAVVNKANSDFMKSRFQNIRPVAFGIY